MNTTPLLTAAAIIRDETQDYHNTATRVGALLAEIIEALGALEKELRQLHTTDLTATTSQIATLYEKLQQAGTSISTLQTTTKEHAAAIANNSKDIKANAASINLHTTDLANNSTDIRLLTHRMEQAEATIEALKANGGGGSTSQPPSASIVQLTADVELIKRRLLIS